MATSTSVNIDLHGIERRIDTLSAATRRIQEDVSHNSQKLDSLNSDLSRVQSDLRTLKKSFEQFVNENRKATALQKAATELIRVRQELEQQFGGYKTVRETMLGVLQATDLALVKKTTISQVTEELMLSTPDYWLAPCLVAVSAWIGNDRDLASRAIAEAVRRDEEKTALTMALICRRNNRTDTCYEWLSLYFARQSAANFTKSNFTYLNAYLNGVFGPDEKHMCDDYVAKWMKEIQRDMKVQTGKDIPEHEVMKVLLKEESHLPIVYAELVNGMMREKIHSLELELSERGYSLDYINIIYVGGGALMAREHAGKFRNHTAYDCDLCANAKGYEFLAGQMLERR